MIRLYVYGGHEKTPWKLMPVGWVCPICGFAVLTARFPIRQYRWRVCTLDPADQDLLLELLEEGSEQEVSEGEHEQRGAGNVSSSR